MKDGQGKRKSCKSVLVDQPTIQIIQIKETYAGKNQHHKHQWEALVEMATILGIN